MLASSSALHTKSWATEFFFDAGTVPVHYGPKFYVILINLRNTTQKFEVTFFIEKIDDTKCNTFITNLSYTKDTIILCWYSDLLSFLVLNWDPLCPHRKNFLGPKNEKTLFSIWLIWTLLAPSEITEQMGLNINSNIVKFDPQILDVGSLRCTNILFVLINHCKGS